VVGGNSRVLIRRE